MGLLSTLLGTGLHGGLGLLQNYLHDARMVEAANKQLVLKNLLEGMETVKPESPEAAQLASAVEQLGPKGFRWPRVMKDMPSGEATQTQFSRLPAGLQRTGLEGPMLPTETATTPMSQTPKEVLAGLPAPSLEKLISSGVRARDPLAMGVLAGMSRFGGTNPYQEKSLALREKGIEQTGQYQQDLLNQRAEDSKTKLLMFQGLMEIRRSNLHMAAINAKNVEERNAIDDLRQDNWNIEKAISSGRPAEEVIPLIDQHNKTRDMWASKYPSIEKSYPRLDPILETGLISEKPLLSKQKVLGTKPGAPTGAPKAPKTATPKEPPKVFKGASFTGKFDAQGYPIYDVPGQGPMALPWP